MNTSMLAEADAGILFRPPQNVIDEFPQFPVAREYAELKAQFAKASLRGIFWGGPRSRQPFESIPSVRQERIQLSHALSRIPGECTAQGSSSKAHATGAHRAGHAKRSLPLPMVMLPEGESESQPIFFASPNEIPDRPARNRIGRDDRVSAVRRPWARLSPATSLARLLGALVCPETTPRGHATDPLSERAWIRSS